MGEVVAADIGGTHARFAIATIDEDGRIALGEPITLRCAEHATFEEAWHAFAERAGRALPKAAALAIASHVEGDRIELTNNPWVIDRRRIVGELGLCECLLLNDFAAVAHAVGHLGPEGFAHFCGPDRPFPDEGTVSIVGPGTGFGAAMLVRSAGHYHVVPTEGGHVEFAPVDAVEDAIRDLLRTRHTRVSVERVVSGPGLAAIYETITGVAESEGDARSDAELWAAALDGSDRDAVAAFERFCLCFGSFTGDLALAQGAVGVVIAGGLGARIASSLSASRFHARFTAKGRFQAMMEALPVKLLAHPQPGLLGAAVAFARASRA